ncbi:hypothetical protein [Halomarina ordinaria]|uniref:Uncharacterized protein n=1 Tax=Halomarina ordinaria TaxID=3033939 RepID=A0ABD5U7L3_9EURY|nr:hypothetical protein [Halomarina sp. PSRA2]
MRRPGACRPWRFPDAPESPGSVHTLAPWTWLVGCEGNQSRFGEDSADDHESRPLG